MATTMIPNENNLVGICPIANSVGVGVFVSVGIISLVREVDAGVSVDVAGKVKIIVGSGSYVAVTDGITVPVSSTKAV